MPNSSSPPVHRSVSIQGAAAMTVGLGLFLFETLTGMMRDRLGVYSEYLLYFAAVSLSVWGLKELIVSFWPGLAKRGMRFRLPTEGALYLVIMIVLFIGSMIGKSNTLLMVFALFAGSLIMNGNMAFVMLRSLSVSRELPKRVMVGEPFTGTITLANGKWWLSAWVMICRDLVRHHHGSLQPEIVFMRVPPKSQQRGHYELCLHKRGEYLFGPITVDTRFPLGLIERGISFADEAKLLVYPRIGRMLPSWRNRITHASELVSHVQPQSGPFNDEMHSTREYRAGDDTRLIHWRTSARMNELMVKEYRESRDRHLLVIVDAWQDPKKNEADVELLLRFAATLCLDQQRHSRETSLNVRLIGQKTLDWFGEIGNSQTEQMLDLFAMADSTTNTNPQPVLDSLSELRDKTRRVLVLSTRSQLVRQLIQQAAQGELVSGETQVLGISPEETGPLYDDQPQ
ncbi:MAG: DUF58 domain-containing protein [Planctomycetaceae bacterium]